MEIFYFIYLKLIKTFRIFKRPINFITKESVICFLINYIYNLKPTHIFI